MTIPDIRADFEPPSPAEVLKMRAQQDLEAIRSLRRLPACEGYLLRRLKEKMEPLRDAILTNRLCAEDYREKQTQLLTLQEIARMLDTDEAANLSILQG